MKVYRCTPLFCLLSLLFVLSSCSKRKPVELERIDDNLMVIYETIPGLSTDADKHLKEVKLGDSAEQTYAQVDSVPMVETPVVAEPKSLETDIPTTFFDLRRYNVVVASLSKEDRLEAMKQTFVEEKLPCSVVKSPSRSLYFFIICSTDSKEEADAVRKQFLSEERAETRKIIWNRHFVTTDDAYILENKQRK